MAGTADIYRPHSYAKHVTVQVMTSTILRSVVSYRYISCRTPEPPQMLISFDQMLPGTDEKPAFPTNLLADFAEAKAVRVKSSTLTWFVLPCSDFKGTKDC